MSRVSVVIPNYNGIKYMDTCMKCLEAQNYKDFDVIVVDNASEDGSQDIPLKYSDSLSVTVVKFMENLGFSAAVNEGILKSKAEYVFLLNNDAYAGKHCIEELVSKMDSDDTIFSAQALMLQYRDKNLVDSAGDYFSAMGWAFSAGKDKSAEMYVEDKEVFSCCAGAAIYRKKVFEQIGMFDENFFAYLEDVDIGYRARLHGYRNVLVTKARVLHVGSGASGSRHNAFKVKLSVRNSFLVMYKNFATWQRVVNMPLVGIGILIKTLFFARKGLYKAYNEGLKEYRIMKKKVSRTKAVNSKIYPGIERELFCNSFLRFVK